MTTIYVDNAATTKTSRTAIEAMLPYMDKIYGNPSSLHSVGQAAADRRKKGQEAYNLHRVRASCDSAYAQEARKRGL